MHLFAQRNATGLVDHASLAVAMRLVPRSEWQFRSFGSSRLTSSPLLSLLPAASGQFDFKAMPESQMANRKLHVIAHRLLPVKVCAA
jgi:hypothetical protein